MMIRHSLTAACWTVLLATLRPSFAAENAPATLSAGQPPSPDYKLVFSDEFNGDRVDETVWDYRLGKRGGEDETAGWINALNRKENVSVVGGYMHVRHAQEQINGKTENTCGGLISKHRFGFGYFECRWKPFMITTAGTHGAFWIRGISRNGQPGEDPTRPVLNTILEIDSSEISSPHYAGTHNLYPAISDKGGPFPWVHRNSMPVQPDADGFVVNAFEYRPDGVIFYDNGHEVARTKWNKLTAQQEIWLTSLAGAGWRSMDASQLKGDALFDYVRFYARDWPGANLLANASFQYNTDLLNPQNPVGWAESGDINASAVVTGNAAHDTAFLRHSADTAYKVTTAQTLQHILHGQYTASAYVRASGGQRVARFQFRSGDSQAHLDIPATAEWTRVELPSVQVTGHTATIELISDADAGQWLEIDRVAFMKPPAPGQTVTEPPPFRIRDDPRYTILTDDLRSFADGRKYLFDRYLGNGEQFTLCFTLKAARLAAQTPVSRMPAAAKTGWKIQLTANGGLSWVFGNVKENTALLADGVYGTDQAIPIVCTFDRGTATIYVAGKQVASRADLPKSVDDTTAYGLIGTNAGSVTSVQGFDGSIGDVEIYTRCLSADEVARKTLAPR